MGSSSPNIKLLVANIISLLAAILLILVLCIPVIVDIDIRDADYDNIGLITECDSDSCRWTCYRASRNNEVCTNLNLAKAFGAVSVAFVLLYVLTILGMQFGGKMSVSIFKSIGGGIIAIGILTAVGAALTVIFIAQAYSISSRRARGSHSIMYGNGFYAAIIGLVAVVLSMALAGYGFYSPRPLSHSSSDHDYENRSSSNGNPAS
ncbi:hypothetical protein BASA50_004013 [Batrachochytrium salamandrivorans]|uniref:Uncharacterized protein n=1 Tax=Batrachochytrium salamandrivorans TaxID=1357716 RepID=A0ABQ8FK19_9FUNG|nr:hypothetical protein BASA60_010452 [Batrachochytrium salamandrivorans]KAH6598132.1 hypothetical protein BASA50_004013 [Batrachochytrium salamandrivorans]KAH6601940.1 hypothetical protein BASA61_001643 [Batrachochytrium salamandrivorans]KAH9272437.1 hypothetical protein BASA83_005244 [Batrachochytrium salamandrivorans]KAJ1340438.1 hypothetical protein BSLG_004957 [Batrachochytrium salamandrivorans]